MTFVLWACTEDVIQSVDGMVGGLVLFLLDGCDTYIPGCGRTEEVRDGLSAVWICEMWNRLWLPKDVEGVEFFPENYGLLLNACRKGG